MKIRTVVDGYQIKFDGEPATVRINYVRYLSMWFVEILNTADDVLWTSHGYYNKVTAGLLVSGIARNLAITQEREVMS